MIAFNPHPLYRRPIRIMSYVMLGLGVVFCGKSSIAAESLRIQDPPIGPGDRLKIEVYEEPELSMEVIVSASGDFSFPLLEKVNAVGTNSHSLARTMEARLRDERFLRYPSVNITLVTQRTSAVTISGAFHTPGIYPLLPSTRLREFLAENGGIDIDKAGPAIVVQHSDGTSQTISRELLFSEDPAIRNQHNQVLLPGDEVIIPESDVYYVSGAVLHPNQYRIDREMTLRDAIAAAGGWTPEAGRNIFWQRTNAEGNIETLILDRDLLVSDNEEVMQKIGPGESIVIPPFSAYFVGGHVEKPGQFTWEEGITLSKALALAGDPKDFSDGKASILRKDEKGEIQITEYTIRSIRRGKSADPLVQPGDVITVGEGLLEIPFKIRKLIPFALSPFTVF